MVSSRAMLVGGGEERLRRYMKLLAKIVELRALPRRERMSRTDSYILTVIALLEDHLERIRRIGVAPKEVAELITPIAGILLDSLEGLQKVVESGLGDERLVLKLLLDIYEVTLSERVVDMLEEAIERCEDADILVELADEAYDLGLFDVSERALSKLISMGYRRYETLYNLALVNYMMGRCEEAWRIASDIIKSWRRDSIFHLLGAIEIARGEFETAKKLFAKKF